MDAISSIAESLTYLLSLPLFNDIPVWEGGGGNYTSEDEEWFGYDWLFNGYKLWPEKIGF